MSTKKQFTVTQEQWDEMQGATARVAVLEKSLATVMTRNEHLEQQVAKQAKQLDEQAAAQVESEDPEDPKAAAFEKLEKGLVAFAKAKNITKNVWSDGLNAYAQTAEGAALKAAYDEVAY